MEQDVWNVQLMAVIYVNEATNSEWPLEDNAKNVISNTVYIVNKINALNAYQDSSLRMENAYWNAHQDTSSTMANTAMPVLPTAPLANHLRSVMNVIVAPSKTLSTSVSDVMPNVLTVLKQNALNAEARC